MDGNVERRALTSSGEQRLYWVHQNQQGTDRANREAPAVPVGAAVSRIVAGANDIDVERTHEAAEALSMIVDDAFRTMCRVRCKGRTLNVFVRNPGEVDVLRRTWHLEIQSLLRGAVHGVSAVRFAHGPDGFEIPVRTGGGINDAGSHAHGA